MNGPTYVTIDANRTIGGTTSTWLYVSEHGASNNTGGGRILRYNLASLSTPPTDIGQGHFTSPDGILIDAATGNLTIADRARNHIVRIDNTGAVLSVFGSGTAGAADEMHGPVELATDGSNIYIAEHGDTSGTIGGGGSFVSKYTSAGVRVWRVGGIGGGNAQFANTGPYGVAIIGSTLYVTDSFSSRLQTFDLNGVYQSQISMPGALPLGLYVDSTGALWVTQGTNSSDGTGAIQQVQKFPTPGGAASVTLTGGLSLPFSVAVNSATNLAYVADYYNNRVVVFDLAASSSGTAPVINSSSTVSGTVGANLTYTLTATGSPTSFATVDALPAGLTLNTTTGAVTGIPSAAGTTTTHFTATNSAGTSSQYAVVFSISAATSSGTPAAPLGPTITHFDLDLPSVVVGVSADMIVTFDTAVTGVDATDFAVNTQGSATASITGVNAIDATSYRVHFNYTDTDGSIQLAIKTSGTGITDASSNAFRGSGITASPVYGTGTAPAADQTAPAVATVVAGTPSGTSATFTVTFSESVTGVGASDFIITGTSATIGAVTGSGTTWTVPITASGSGSVTLTVVGGATSNIRDAATNLFGGNGTTSAQVTIGGGSSTPTAPVISSATSASATVGTAFSYQISASGSPTSYAATGLTGTGLSLNTTSGSISGTPTAAGTITSQLTATNAAGTSAPVTLTITVAASGGTGTAPTVTSAGTASATVGTAFSYQITASGSPTSFAATGLTGTGLSVNATTGLISGTPTAAGTITSQLTATNSAGTSAAKTLTITVSPAATGTAPSITSATSASATVGTAFNYQITASGSPTSYAATNLAGTGLSLNTATGVISGTPTTAGTLTTQLTATNGTGTSAATTLTITVSAASSGAVPIVTSGGSASATAGTAFNYQILASGSPTSYAATGLTGTGLTLNATTGLISGTPTAAGTITAQLTATNSSGTSAAKTLTITVAPAQAAPSVTSATVNGTVGIPLSLTVTATNSPTLFLLSGQPAGITINQSTGVISGTPTAAGSFTATVTAANGSGSGHATISFNIAADNSHPPLRGQTVIFNTPTSAIVVGSAIQLGATATSGLPITYTLVSGNAALNGDTLTIKGAGPVVIRASQNGDGTWAAASTDLTFNASKASQQIIVGSTNQTVTTDAAVALKAASSSGLPVTYTVISGPATVSGNTLTFTGSGTVLVRASQAGNDTYNSADTTLTFVGNPVTRLVNISSRLRVSAGDTSGASIAGFVITGTAPKQILIRAVGPGLTGYGIAAPLSDPSLKLYDNTGAVIATNTGWANSAQIAAAGDSVGAFKLNPGSADSALLATLAPGAYTVQVQSAKNAGAVLIEVYDASANAAVPTKQLINISTRGFVGTGDDVLIGGFVVNGNEPKRVLVRGIGPGLTAYGVANAIQDPMLKVYDAKGAVIAQNNNWGTAQPINSQQTAATAAEITAANTATGAFPLVSGSADAAVLLTLNPGAYSAVITGANNTTGSAMVEIYEVPNP